MAKILLLEDDDRLRENIKQALEEKSLEVEDFGDSDAGLRALKSGEAYAVVLTDWRLPPAGGEKILAMQVVFRLSFSQERLRQERSLTKEVRMLISVSRWTLRQLCLSLRPLPKKMLLLTVLRKTYKRCWTRINAWFGRMIPRKIIFC